MIKQSFLAIDAIAQRDNIFTKMDARVKVFLSVLFLGTVTASPGLWVPVSLMIVALSAVLYIKTPVSLILGRLVPPLGLGIFFFLLMAFTQGHNAMFSLSLAGIKISIFKEGLVFGTTVLARIAASVAILLFMSVTTPIYEMGRALIWFRIPETVVEILLLTYRYLFVLWDEGMRIRDAQSLRLGYPRWNNPAGWKQALKSTFTLMGMVVIRAFDRAESTYSAMQLRGYNGSMSGKRNKVCTGSDTRFLFIGILLLLVIVLSGF